MPPKNNEQKSTRLAATLALSLLPTEEQELKVILSAVRDSFPWQYLLEFDNIINLILFAFKKQPPKKAQIKTHVAQLEAVSKTNFSYLIERLTVIWCTPNASPISRSLSARLR